MTRTLGLAGVAFAIVVAAACTGGDDDPSPTATAPHQPTVSPAASPEPPTSPTADPTPTPSPAPTATAPQAFVVSHLVAGDQHACALDADGQAWCWGYNRHGQLGDGSTDDSNVPVAVDGDATFVQLAAGRYFTCGLTEAGAPLCWGENSRGQLGNGATGAGSPDENVSTPVAVAGDLTFASLVAGQLHACGLTAGGEAYCWGNYASGALGNAVGEDQTTPVRSAQELTLASLAPGGDVHTCGLTAEGQAWCWGSNAMGRLGDGVDTNVRQPDPRPVSGQQQFTALALGGRHTCGLGEDGAVWCWGDNGRGQVGDGTTEVRVVPTRIQSGLRFEQITAGQAHACALAADDAAWCWGNNAMGRLGSGESGGISPAPVEVAGGIEFAALSAGEAFTCGVDIDGVAWCWGSNGTGWLGTGTNDPSAEPVMVAAP